jgi:hypothetical protein
MDEAIAAIPRLLAMDRRAVRRRFEERFSSARMARDYVHLYRKMLQDTLHDTTETGVTEPPAFNVVEAETMN